MNNRFLAQSAWFVALICLLLSALATSWQLQAEMNYSYRFWYSALEIDQHIDRYGPENRFKRGFAELSDDQRISLFGQISAAVHHQGEGLEAITYPYRNSRVALLREAEIIHLQDVARLIDITAIIGACATLLGFALAFLLVRRKVRPDWKKQVIILAGVLLVITLLVLVLGPKDIFYQLHVWLFPDNHQWFFYYQESLMSTLMKAPDLFGGIALAILSGALLLFAGMILVLRILQQRS